MVLAKALGSSIEIDIPYAVFPSINALQRLGPGTLAIYQVPYDSALLKWVSKTLLIRWVFKLRLFLLALPVTSRDSSGVSHFQIVEIGRDDHGF
ncbi:MAG: hypothetical protein ACI805_001143 [Candidatus Azotimanducaceae bacterium]|jgi:hypothetical protein